MLSGSALLSKCFVYNAGKYLWFIILDLRIDVHSYLTVLMPCQILHCFGIHRSINAIRNVGVTQIHRSHTCNGFFP